MQEGGQRQVDSSDVGETPNRGTSREREPCSHEHFSLHKHVHSLFVGERRLLCPLTSHLSRGFGVSPDGGDVPLRHLRTQRQRLPLWPRRRRAGRSLRRLPRQPGWLGAHTADGQHRWGEGRQAEGEGAAEDETRRQVESVGPGKPDSVVWRSERGQELPGAGGGGCFERKLLIQTMKGPTLNLATRLDFRLLKSWRRDYDINLYRTHARGADWKTSLPRHTLTALLFHSHIVSFTVLVPFRACMSRCARRRFQTTPAPRRFRVVSVSER